MKKIGLLVIVLLVTGCNSKTTFEEAKEAKAHYYGDICKETTVKKSCADAVRTFVEFEYEQERRENIRKHYKNKAEFGDLAKKIGSQLGD